MVRLMRQNAVTMAKDKVSYNAEKKIALIESMNTE